MVYGRGLRLKCGVDVGDVIGEVNAMTGRICYRGKAVTRGAQLVEIAGSSQVRGNRTGDDG